MRYEADSPTKHEFFDGSTFEGLDAVATIEAIGVELALAELYEGIVGPEGPLAV